MTKAHTLTSFETDPVESLNEALWAFVAAYDNLQVAISETKEPESDVLESSLVSFLSQETLRFSAFSDELKLAMYRPVKLEGETRPPISLYEIGVAYFPTTGKYAINKKKLEKALTQRGEDIRALFVQEDGLLPRLCEMLADFLDEVISDELNAAALWFLNECRRLTAMWA